MTRYYNIQLALLFFPAMYLLVYRLAENRTGLLSAAVVSVRYRRAADLNNNNDDNNNNTGWLRENNSEMKPIWFSLFDFCTADQWKRW